MRRGGARPAGRDSPLAELAQRYQGPSQAYLSTALGLSGERAHELFQEFHAWLLESELLAKPEPGRGRFRVFLQAALRRFVADELRKETADERDWKSPPSAPGTEVTPEPLARARAPEELMEETWRAAIVDAALERTRLELEHDGLGLQFEVIRDGYLGGGPEPDCAALAERHGLTSADVSNHLQRVKGAYREHLRTIVLDTVSSPEDLGDELAWLATEEKKR